MMACVAHRWEEAISCAPERPQTTRVILCPSVRACTRARLCMRVCGRERAYAAACLRARLWAYAPAHLRAQVRASLVFIAEGYTLQ